MMRFLRISTWMMVLICSSACVFSANVVDLSYLSIDQNLMNDGLTAYRQNYCGSCHTLSIANTRGTFAPNHDTILADSEAYIGAPNYTGDAHTIEAYIRESIVNPSIFYTPSYEASNHHMPSFAHLSDADIHAITYMLMNQAYYQAETE